jgi:uncharacterized protein
MDAELLARIKCLLQNADVSIQQVLLFGSRAVGDSHDESDVDLIIVLDRDAPFPSFTDKMKVVIELRKNLREISRTMGLDLLVYTRPEWESFSAEKTSFSREIASNALRVA